LQRDDESKKVQVAAGREKQEEMGDSVTWTRSDTWHVEVDPGINSAGRAANKYANNGRTLWCLAI